MFKVGDKVILVLHNHPVHGPCNLIQGKEYTVTLVDASQNLIEVDNKPVLYSMDRFILDENSLSLCEKISRLMKKELESSYNEGYKQGKKDKEAEIKSKLGL